MNSQTEQKLLNIVKNNYEEIAEHFSSTRSKGNWPEIIKLTKDIKSGSVLDLGCGNGRVAELFKNKKINYLGVDQSNNLIKIAQTKYKNKSNINFKVLNILDIKSTKKFDYIFLLAVLPHIPSHDLRIKLLNNISKLLKKDGKLIITCWNLYSQPKYKKLILKNNLLKILGLNKMDFGDIVFDWKDPKGSKVSQRYYHAFSQESLTKLINKTDLVIKNQYTIKQYSDKYNIYTILMRIPK